MSAEKNSTVLCFSGDSGDGIQSIGQQMADDSINYGNYVYTASDFPAEIRAPAGTLRGVSSFQLRFADHKIFTSGDVLDVLVVFNPAALKCHLKDLSIKGILIVDTDKFTESDLKKAGYENNPLDTDIVNNYKIIKLPITTLTQESIKQYDLMPSKASKCKNMFILGMLYYLYNRDLDFTLEWIKNKFKDQNLINANQTAFQFGYSCSRENKNFPHQILMNKSKDIIKSEFMPITGNQAIARCCIDIAKIAPKGLFTAGYPITPASSILQELTKIRSKQLITFQAEDEISAASACVGAAFGGSIAITFTSGPGFDLKQEVIGLAVMAELPLVVVNVQRSGPSTGMPTKSEQTDLFAAIYGRHGEAPLVVMAPLSPSDCFNITLEAVQIAVKYMVPVIILSDAILANVSETWKISDQKDIKQLKINYHINDKDFNSYDRDPKTLARPWAIPGTFGLTHRLGGLEKKDVTGEVSYEQENHEKMIKIRAQKVDKVADFFPRTKIEGDIHSKTLIISWGSTFGVIKDSIDLIDKEGKKVAYIHLRYLNPLPNDLGDLIRKFSKIVVVESNLGQLTQILRAKYLVDIKLISRITGRQFFVDDLKESILNFIE